MLGIIKQQFSNAQALRPTLLQHKGSSNGIKHQVQIIYDYRDHQIVASNVRYKKPKQSDHL